METLRKWLGVSESELMDADSVQDRFVDLCMSGDIDDQQISAEARDMIREAKASKGTDKQKKKKKRSKKKKKQSEKKRPFVVSVPGLLSPFNAFAQVRERVLNARARAIGVSKSLKTDDLGVATSTKAEEEEGEDEDKDTEASQAPAPLSKLTMMGLQSTFEIVQDVCTADTALAERMLLSLLKILEGLDPEAMYAEDAELLNELATMFTHLVTSVKNNRLKAILYQCMLALAVARGDPSKTLPTILPLLNDHSSVPVTMPENMKTVVASALNHAYPNNTIPWVKVCPGPATQLFSMPLADCLPGAAELPRDTPKALAVGADHVIFLSGSSITKLGSGFNGTSPGFFMGSMDLDPSSGGSWLGYVSGRLLYRSETDASGVFLLIDSTTLQPTGVIAQVSDSASLIGDLPYCLFTSPSGDLGVVEDTPNGWRYRILTIGTVNGQPSLTDKETRMLSTAKVHVRLDGAADWSVDDGPSRELTFPSGVTPLEVVTGQSFAVARSDSGDLFVTSTIPKLFGVDMRQGVWNNLPKPAGFSCVGLRGSHAVDGCLLLGDDTIFIFGEFEGTDEAIEQRRQRHAKATASSTFLRSFFKAPSSVADACLASGMAVLALKDGTVNVITYKNPDGDKPKQQDKRKGKKDKSKEEKGKDIKLSQAVLTTLEELPVGRLFSRSARRKAKTCHACSAEFSKDDHVFTSIDRELAKFYCEKCVTKNKLSELSVTCKTLRVPLGGSGVEPRRVCVNEKRLVVLTSEGRVFDSHPGVNDDTCSVTQARAKEEQEKLKEAGALPCDHDFSHPAGSVAHICPACNQCTNSGKACYRAAKKDREKGAPCGCGDGDPGCLKCGMCKTCAKEGKREDGADSEQKSLTAVLDPPHAPRVLPEGFELSRVQQEEEFADVCAGEEHVVALTVDGKVFVSGSNEDGQLGLPDMVCTVPFTHVPLPSEARACGIAAGARHTAVVLEDGRLVTFGRSDEGQLGAGRAVTDDDRKAAVEAAVDAAAKEKADAQEEEKNKEEGEGEDDEMKKPAADEAKKGEDSKEKDKKEAEQGDEKKAEGAEQKEGDQEEDKKKKDDKEEEEDKDKAAAAAAAAVAEDKAVAERASKAAKAATNAPRIVELPMAASTVSAAGSATIVFMGEDVFDKSVLAKSSMACTGQYLLALTPQGGAADAATDGTVCLATFNLTSGLLVEKNTASGIGRGSCLCFSAQHDTLALYDNTAAAVSFHRTLLTDVERKPHERQRSYSDLAVDPRAFLLSPSNVVGPESAATAPRALASTFLSVLAAMNHEPVGRPKAASDKVVPSSPSTGIGLEDVTHVSRYSSQGGGWGYGGSSPDAIGFKVNQPIAICGFGLYGQDSMSFNATMKLFVDGKAEEPLATKTTTYSSNCPGRNYAAILFDEPVTVEPHQLYIAWALIQSPHSSICGSSGQSVVEEDGVQFNFVSTHHGSNGTDVSSGQVPAILFCTLDKLQGSTDLFASTEQSFKLSPRFYRQADVGGLEGLLNTLSSTWQHLLKAKAVPAAGKSTKSNTHFHVGVFARCLHLIEQCVRSNFELDWLGNVTTRPKPDVSTTLFEEVLRLRHFARECLSTAPKNAATRKALELITSTFKQLFKLFYPTTRLQRDLFLEVLMHGKTDVSDPQAEAQPLLLALLSVFSQPGFNFPKLFLAKSTLVSETAKTMQVVEVEGEDAYEALTVSTNSVRANALKTSEPEVWESNGPSGTHWIQVQMQPNVYISELTLVAASRDSYRPSRVDVKVGTEDDLSSMCSINCDAERKGDNITMLSDCDEYYPVVRLCISADGINTRIRQLVVVGEQRTLQPGLADAEVMTPYSEYVMAQCGMFAGKSDDDDVSSDLFREVVHRLIAMVRGTAANGSHSIEELVAALLTSTTTQLSLKSAMATQHPQPQGAAPAAAASQESQSKLASGFVVTVLQEALMVLNSGQVDVSTSPLFTKILPSLLAHASFLEHASTAEVLEVVGLIQELLGRIAAMQPASSGSKADSGHNKADNTDESAASSPRLVVVETAHPYEQAVRQQRAISFDKDTSCLGIEFDPRSSFSQVEDKLVIWVRRSDSEDFVEFMSFTGNTDFPSQSLILPGHAAIFELQTATDYQDLERENNESCFGFKATVVGYKFSECSRDLLHILERELTLVGGMCAASLLKKKAITRLSRAELEEDDEDEGKGKKHKHKAKLTSDEKKERKELAAALDAMASSLFSKGLRLPDQHKLLEFFKEPSVKALMHFHPREEGNFDQMFLRNFVDATPNTPGGRLAEWLQGPCAVNPRSCTLEYMQPGKEVTTIKQGDTCKFKLQTRATDGGLIHHPNTMVRFIAKRRRDKATSSSEPASKGKANGNDATAGSSANADADKSSARSRDVLAGLEPRKTAHGIEYQSLFARGGVRYSPEEARLRYLQKAVEQVSTDAVEDGVYAISWKPTEPGVYDVDVVVDGQSILAEKRAYVVEEDDHFNSSDKASTASDEEEEAARAAVDKELEELDAECENDVVMTPGSSKFKAIKDVVVRAAPSQESIGVGKLSPGDIIDTSDLQTNAEGMWVKLAGECIFSCVEESMRHLDAWVPHHISELFGGAQVLEDLAEDADVDSKGSKQSSAESPAGMSAPRGGFQLGPGPFGSFGSGPSGSGSLGAPAGMSPFGSAFGSGPAGGFGVGPVLSARPPAPGPRPPGAIEGLTYQKNEVPTFGQPVRAFGAPAPAFGAPAPAFGAPAFGAPAFGAPAPAFGAPAPAFGAPGPFGAKPFDFGGTKKDSPSSADQAGSALAKTVKKKGKKKPAGKKAFDMFHGEDVVDLVTQESSSAPGEAKPFSFGEAAKLKTGSDSSSSSSGAKPEAAASKPKADEPPLFLERTCRQASYTFPVARLVRTIYAVFLWHANFMPDAVLLATHLKFQPDMLRPRTEEKQRQETQRLRKAFSHPPPPVESIEHGATVYFTNSDSSMPIKAKVKKVQVQHIIINDLKVEVGMRLEAKDRLNPNMIAPANVIAVLPDNRIRINFDGWSARYDYEASLDDADLHPIGYAQSINHKLERPNGYGERFVWPEYLRDIKARPVPFELLSHRSNQKLIELDKKAREMGNGAIAHPIHEHLLRHHLPNHGWVCDGRHQQHDFCGCDGGGGLFGGVAYGGTPRFRCMDGCDYDLCLGCVATSRLLYDRKKYPRREDAGGGGLFGGRDGLFADDDDDDDEPSTSEEEEEEDLFGDGSEGDAADRPTRQDVKVLLEVEASGKEVEVPLSNIRFVDDVEQEAEESPAALAASQVPLVPRLLASSWDQKEDRALFVLSSIMRQFSKASGLTIESAFYGEPAANIGKDVTTTVQYFVSEGTLQLPWKYDVLFGPTRLPQPKLRIVYKVRGVDGEELINETDKDVPVRLDAEQIARARGVDWDKVMRKLTAPDDDEDDKKKKKNKGKQKDKKEENAGPVPVPFGGFGGFGGGFGAPQQDQVCELCKETHPSPITYHMRKQHPGCGKNASGMGYNSGGSYDSGWVGNCGDGGIGGNTWYLLCRECREKYMHEEKSDDEEEEEGVDALLATALATALPSIDDEGEAEADPDATTAVGLLKRVGLKAEFLLNLEPFEHEARFTSASAADDVDSDATLDPTAGSLYMELKQELLDLQPPEPDADVLGRSISAAPTRARPTLRKQQTLGGEALRKLSGDITAALSPLRRNVTDDPTALSSTAAGSLSPQRGKHTRRGVSSTSGADDAAGTGAGAGAGAPRPRRPGQLSRALSLPYPDDEQEAQHTTVPNSPTSARGQAPRGFTAPHEALLGRPSKQLRKFAKSDGQAELTKNVLDFVSSSASTERVARLLKAEAEHVYQRLQGLRLFIVLLKSVMTPGAVQDLLWYFVSTLAKGRKPEVDSEGVDVPLPLGKHPLGDIDTTNTLVGFVRHTYHHLLSVVLDFMRALPASSPVQQIALRCWALPFQEADLPFLHRSQIFSVVSGHVSLGPRAREAEGEQEVVEWLERAPVKAEVSVASKEALKDSLSDSDTQTFWESDESPEGGQRWIQLEIAPGERAEQVAVFIDNGRDSNHRVSKVRVETGPSAEKLVGFGSSISVSSKFVGWLTLPCAHSSKGGGGSSSGGGGGDKKAGGGGSVGDDDGMSACASDAAAPAGGDGDGDGIAVAMPPAPRVVRIHLSGASKLRVRQVRAYGPAIQDASVPNSRVQYMRHRAGEALRLFRELTMQIFMSGKTAASKKKKAQGEAGAEGLGVGAQQQQQQQQQAQPGEAAGEGDNTEMKEQVVGILFQEGQELNALQAEVCRHFFNEVKRKTTALTESGACLQETDEVYMHELLTLIRSLTASEAGLRAISKESDMLNHLLVLLNIGTTRVQQQAVATLHKLLEYLPYDRTVKMVDTLPIAKVGYGPLSVLLLTVAKCLTLQVRGRGKDKFSTTVTFAQVVDKDAAKSALPSKWLVGHVEEEVVPSVLMLVSDLVSKLPSYQHKSKAVLTQLVSTLTEVEGKEGSSRQEVITDPQVWLSLAALCVIDGATALDMTKAASSEARESQLFCDNHDDGETHATHACAECEMNLCTECERVLHLPRRKRDHTRTRIGEASAQLQVELNEGCGRARLPQLLAIADRKSLKAVLEFKMASGTVACRFCEQPLGDDGGMAQLVATGIKNVCSDPDCIELAKNSCTKTLTCGHACCGIRGEEKCLPCLRGCKPEVEAGDGEEGGQVARAPLTQDNEDQCMICFTGALQEEPCIQTPCGHVFHFNCVKRLLEVRWNGPRITFGFCKCPICSSSWIHKDIPALQHLLQPLNDLYDEVRRKALMRLNYDGKDEEAPTEEEPRAEYAMRKYAYFPCHKCGKAYFGGAAACEAGRGSADFDPTELVCPLCVGGAATQICRKHGTEFLEYKCRYCCSVAVFFCFGTTHFCNACHDQYQRCQSTPKELLPQCPAGPCLTQLEGDECPLHVKHPPTGEEFALGCGLCRNAQTF
ncbi:hypothetical protein PTSG_11546 [Salpingoeca rosetta]|uniref:RCR-type E3 ubiquitin transferase n=1 Tax=Salpingoeca rosetta (strain ATCC 50818 / BSB-021) TaxID=946362 RepID=F2TVK2_SALR5|nr:uncharacterized protein PTSG_11546 [Salpingoeca rosetta]EGD72098.1 hypothetical protein PTSG_11546 [Salpingoeca rosetta]|eukprot:XP_004998670.1 hypothetical protein PTSG_11546 [Salpingoeca rosetta]